MKNKIMFVFCFNGDNLADLAVIKSRLADLEHLVVLVLLVFLAEWISFFGNAHEL